MGKVCPVHGDEMVVRTAKSGSRAGQRFWGCPRYPNCTITLPFDESADNPQAVATRPSPRHEEPSDLPRSVTCAARSASQQVSVVESMAVPASLLQLICDEELSLDPALWQYLAQWRVDFPAKSVAPSLDSTAQRTLAVLEKLVFRGRLTLLSESLEQRIATLLGIRVPTTFTVDDLTGLVEQWPLELPRVTLDSPAETAFYDAVLREASRRDPWLAVVPQIEIASLAESAELSPDSTRRRVDFMVWHLGSKRKVVIEVDGDQHVDQVVADADRDRILKVAGYDVVRVPASQIMTGAGADLENVRDLLSRITRPPSERPRSASTVYLKAVAVAHQIQAVLVQGMKYGRLPLTEPESWSIATDLDHLAWFDPETTHMLVTAAVEDFVELLRAVASVHGCPVAEGMPTCTFEPSANGDFAGIAQTILFDPRSESGESCFHVLRCALPFHVAMAFYSPIEQVSPPLSPSDQTLLFLLQYIFRFREFSDEQRDAIKRVLAGKDTLALLPTGAGKSLIYQFASLLLPGRTIVIDPLLSLMDDQVEGLKAKGIDRITAINSNTTTKVRTQLIQLLGQGEYLFAFVSPERFQIKEFRLALRALTSHTCVSVIVIDEVHCVSEWGHDFRPAYLNLGRTARKYCAAEDGSVPPILGLTGTASRAVLRDVQRELHLQDFDSVVTPKTFDRENLHFMVLSAKSSEKWGRLEGLLGQRLPSLFGVTTGQFFGPNGDSTYAGLVFCPHVNGSFGVVQIATKLNQELRIPVSFYSGKVPDGHGSGEYAREKTEVARKFKRNKIPVLACTSAFGMGIDKPNIRYTVHYGIPGSIESFYQEAGRAGRARTEPLEPAYCCIIVSNDDPARAERLLSMRTSVEGVAQVVKDTNYADSDDTIRRLFFHVTAFRGASLELDEVARVLSRLEAVGVRHDAVVVPFGTAAAAGARGDARTPTEKALHRLLIVGVVSDYTLDYSKQQFEVDITGATRTDMIASYTRYVESYLASMRAPEQARAEALTSPDGKPFVLDLVRLLLDFVYHEIEQSRRRNLAEMLRACQHSGEDALRQSILRYLERTQFSDQLDVIVADPQAGTRLVQDVARLVASPNEAAELRGQVSRYLSSYATHPGLLMLRAVAEAMCRDANAGIVHREFTSAIESALTGFSLDRTQVLYEFATWGVSTIGSRDGQLGSEIAEELLHLNPDRDFARHLVKAAPSIRHVPAWFLVEQATGLADKTTL
jgi:ATP-dependent DNA helicase RecQ